jgi:uncharacterized repeat protein (TIGR02543 family)
MATVNIATQGWNTSISNLNVSVDSSSIVWGRLARNNVGYAKAYVEIDASKYKSVTLEYGSGIHTSNSAITFGVFDNTSATDSSGKTKTVDRSSSGTITISLDGVTGTKYVGFFLWANSWIMNDWGYYEAEGNKSIVSLSAELAGYTLTYNANGGSGEPKSVSGVMSTTISSTVPTRSGYDFLGWSTSKTATSASYFAGNTISLSSNITLYAVWREKTYTVTYDASGGSGAPSDQTKTHGTTLTLSSTKPTKDSTSAGSYTVTLNANGGTCAYGSLSAERTTSYTFSKWNTNSSGTGTSYSPGASYTSNKALTLYAIYNSSTSIESVTLPTPERDGYEFMGWATSNMADSGVTGDYTPTKNVTLHAIWKSMGIVYIYDGVEYSPYKVLIYDGSGWNQYMPYIYTESGWEVYSG